MVRKTRHDWPRHAQQCLWAPTLFLRATPRLQCYSPIQEPTRSRVIRRRLRPHGSKNRRNDGCLSTIFIYNLYTAAVGSKKTVQRWRLLRQSHSDCTDRSPIIAASQPTPIVYCVPMLMHASNEESGTKQSFLSDANFVSQRHCMRQYRLNATFFLKRHSKHVRTMFPPMRVPTVTGMVIQAANPLSFLTLQLDPSVASVDDNGP